MAETGRPGRGKEEVTAERSLALGLPRRHGNEGGGEGGRGAGILLKQQPLLRLSCALWRSGQVTFSAVKFNTRERGRKTRERRSVGFIRGGLWAREKPPAVGTVGRGGPPD